MEPTGDFTDTAASAWSRAFPDADLLDYGIVIRIIRAGRLMGASLDRIAEDHGFGVRGDFEVLAALRRSHPVGLRPQDLADRVMISAAGMTGRLDRLEQAGLIARTPHPGDRRSTLISITALGLEQADRTFESVIYEAGQLLDGLSDPWRRRLTRELRQLLKHLGDGP